MGVIYKLNQEVVDFIINHKKNDPSLSCRKLAEITSNQFQTKVSKSSVNSVLKDLNLSNEVGRPKFAPKIVPKFEIPKEKKNIIADNIRSAGGDLIKETEIKQPVLNNEIFEKKLIKIPADILNDIPKRDFDEIPLLSDSILNDSKSSINIDLVAKNSSFYKKVNYVREKHQNIPIQENVGLIVLAAAQWHLTRKDFFGQLIRKYSSKIFPTSFEDEINRLFLWSASNKKNQQRLWFMNNFDDLKSYENILNDSLDEKNLNGLSAQYLFEKQKINSFVAGFKFILEDKTELFIDAGLSGVNKNAMAMPIPIAIEILSSEIVANKCCAVIGKISADNNMSKDVLELLLSFECEYGKKIVKISILNDEYKELADFSILPNIKRFYIVGIYSDLKEYKEIIKSSQWAERFIYFHELTDKVYYYTLTKTDFFSNRRGQIKERKLITFFDENGESQIFALITNLDMPCEEIIKIYLDRWPGTFLIKDTFNSSPISKIETRKDFFTKDILNDFKLFLQQFIQDRILQSDLANTQEKISWEKIYDLKGKIILEKDHAIVYFQKNESDVFDLELLVNKLNMMNIKDFKEKKLIFRVL